MCMASQQHVFTHLERHLAGNAQYSETEKDLLLH